MGFEDFRREALKTPSTLALAQHEKSHKTAWTYTGRRTRYGSDGMPCLGGFRALGD